MNANTITINYAVLFATGCLAATVFLLILTTKWAESRESRRTAGFRWKYFSLVNLGIGCLVLGLASAPVPAKELFSIPSKAKGGFEFYQLESSIQDLKRDLAGTTTSRWPGLQKNPLNDSLTFSDSKVQKSSLKVDPGFRTSLTNRIITVAGRIAWHSGMEEIHLLPPLSEEGSLDLAKRNRERLTGIYETAWNSAYESSVSGYN